MDCRWDHRNELSKAKHSKTSDGIHAADVDQSYWCLSSIKHIFVSIGQHLKAVKSMYFLVPYFQLCRGSSRWKIQTPCSWVITTFIFCYPVFTSGNKRGLVMTGLYININELIVYLEDPTTTSPTYNNIWHVLKYHMEIHFLPDIDRYFPRITMSKFMLLILSLSKTLAFMKMRYDWVTIWIENWLHEVCSLQSTEFDWEWLYFKQAFCMLKLIESHQEIQGCTTKKKRHQG